MPENSESGTGAGAFVFEESLPSLSYDSDLSNESYTSADNYYGNKNIRSDQSEHIAKYIEGHPMTEMFEAQKWNNIPIVVKEVFKMMCEAFMG